MERLIPLQDGSGSSTIEFLKSALTFLLTPSPIVLIAGTAAVLLIPIILHLIFSSTASFHILPSVLLVGPSGAGKTALLTLYERGPTSPKNQNPRPAATHTSQIPAAVELAVDDDDEKPSSFRDDLDAREATAKKFLLVDTPGHPKLRREAMARLTGTNAASSKKGGSSSSSAASRSSASHSAGDSGSKVKAAVFMVDAAALGEELPATAEYLYEVLLALQKRHDGGRSSRAPTAIPLLVAANKQDLFTAMPPALVQSKLELEITRIRKARSKGLLDSGVGADDAVAEEADWLGEYGSEKFTFASMHAHDIEVDVLGGNIVGEGGPNVDKWWEWIAEAVKAP